MGRFLGAVVLVSMALPWPVAAQTGAITGTVRDQAGAVMPGVTITVTQTDTNDARFSVTGDRGTYSVTVLPIGNYRIHAELAGFKTAVAEGITLNVNDTLRIDLTLQVGQVSETVVVAGAAPLVESESSALGSVIDNQKIVELPLNGRRFETLAHLVPGVVATSPSAQLFSTGGARTTSNNFVLDGVDNNDPATNSFTLRPIVDAIQEFKVQTSSYSAEFGRGGGANLQVTTKSGTNDFRATMWEFLRNDALDARNFFAPPNEPKPPFRRNQFGATAGGSVIQDRTFFFAAYEGLRRRQTFSNLQSVPSLAFRSGNFAGFGSPLRDPVNGGVFPSNAIPFDRIHPAAQRMLALGVYPEPTPGLTGPTNLRAQNPFPQDLDQMSARIDHRLSQASRLSGRYSAARDDLQSPCPELVATCIPGYGSSNVQRTQSLSVLNTHVFTNRLLSELRVGFNRSTFPRIALRSSDKENHNISAELGVPGLPASQDPRDYGFPTVTITGLGTIGDRGYQTRAGTTVHMADTVHYVTGTHSMRAGVEARLMRFNAQIGRARDVLSFDGRFTGNGFADFLLGFPSSTTRNAEDFERARAVNSYNAFFQDDIKVGSNLTVNAGLRYEYNSPDVEREDRLVNVNTETYEYEIAGRNGASRALYNPDKNNFAPRIGLAYRPTGSADLVVRGGYGVFYDLFTEGNDLGPTRQGPPFFLGETFDASTNPLDLTLSDPFPISRLRPTSVFNIRAVDTNLRDAYFQQFNVSVERALTRDVVVEIGYIGSRGRNLFRNIDINQALPGPGTVQSRRPLQQYGSLNVLQSTGISSYDALIARLERRFSNGLSFLTSYTYGHSIDTGSSGVTVGQDARNLDAERASSDFDARHRFVASYVWELPIGRGRRFASAAGPVVDGLIGGWQVAGITTLQSGQPLTPSISGQRSQTGSFLDRPNVTGIDPIVSGNPDPTVYLNPAAYELPPIGAFGNAGRNSVVGPGVTNTDISVSKQFRPTSEVRLQFRAELFNAFNRPLFAQPVAFVNVPAFGRITSTRGDNRQVQLGLKIDF